MSTWPFKKVQLPNNPLDRLVCSIPRLPTWQGDWKNVSDPRLEVALLRIHEPWEPNRFAKNLQTLVEIFPALRATLSPEQKAMAVHESPRMHWRLLEPNRLEKLLTHGWTAASKADLQLELSPLKLWEAQVAPEDDDTFLFCLVAHPAIADMQALHRMLGQFQQLFSQPAPSHAERAELAREQLELFCKGAWDAFHAVKSSLPAPNPTLPRRARTQAQAASCSFRLPTDTWAQLSQLASSSQLPTSAVAGMILHAALRRLFEDDLGPILFKNPDVAEWEAITVSSELGHHAKELFQAFAAAQRQRIAATAQSGLPEGLRVGFTLLPATPHQDRLRTLSSDPGPADLLWLCPEGEGESFLTWTDQAWEADFPTCLAALLKEIAIQWAESPEKPLRDLALDDIVLPLWQKWNESYKPYDLEQTIPQLLAPALQKAGDSIAIRSRFGNLSYRQLDEQSRQLALLLRAQGIGPDDLFGIALPRTPAMMVALLGVLRAGAGYVPLDPGFPAERLQYMLKDAKVKGCFCEESMRTLIEASCPAWIWQDVEGKIAAYEPKQWLDPAQDPSSIAYVIYTSGSTGQPKGVMLAHRSVVNFLLSMQEAPGLDSSDRVLAITTLSFDIAVLELLLPLLCGASLYLVNAEESKDGTLLRQLIEQKGITLMQATPSNFRLLLDAGWKGSKIRKALCGGEAFPIDVARRLLPVVPEVWNMYGPTETTVWSTIHRIQKIDGMVPIGRPIANTAIYILDDNLQPVLPGVKGEIYIGGSGLALGYLGRSDLTAERFQMIPALSALAYKTGDIGRFLWNGELEIFGRADHQVKLRGYRMELGEIEAVIASLPGIEQCVAAVKEFGPDDPRLIAYVTTTAGYQERQIRQAAKDKLPPYMLPAHYVVLEKMPLLPNGKTDRKKLPHPLDMKKEGPEPAAVTADPPAETRIQTEVIASSKPQTPPPEAAAVTLLSPANPAARTMQAPAALPLTPSQARMLFTEEFYPGTTVHNLVGAWMIHGAMDFQAFRRALEVLIIEQDSLRMAAVHSEEGHVLQLSPPFAPELRIYGREKPNMTTEEVSEAIVKLAQEKLDPTQVPNFRMGLFRLNTNTTVFFLITHHIFWDGLSYGVLWKNVQRLYKEILVSGRAEAHPPAFNFSQYAAQRQTELGSPHMRAELDYWLSVYQDLPEPLELAYDFSRPSQLHHRAFTAWIPWDQTLDSQLQEAAKALSCTVYHLLLSTYYILLYRLSGQNDLVVGTPVHGRQQVEVFELLGNFINVVALRQKLEPGSSFVQLVQAVKKATTDAMARSDLPFENLVAALKLPRDPGRTPLYNTMFFYQDQSLQRIQFGTTAVEVLRVPNTTVDTDLILFVERHAQKTFAGFNFRSDLWEQGTVESFAQSFRQLLDELLAQPEQTLQKPALLTARQKELLLETMNASALPAPSVLTLPALLMQEARRSPQRIAVSDLHGNSLSWSELDRRSKQLAHFLRQNGVGPGSVVGICHSRKLDLIVGLLAILRAGAAYLPLDPLFPIERLNYMVDDSGTKLILTEASYAELLRSSNAALVYLDKDRDSWSSLEIDDDARLLPAPSDLAYIIYTSGSTGKPKGVEIQHQAVATFLHSFRAAVALPDQLRTLAITTISFDISVLEIFGTLVWGGTIVLLEQEKLMDGPALIKAMGDYRINVLQATPATWRLLLESRWFGQRELIALCGGEALPRDLARELLPRTQALWNVYGPTEATVWATVAPITNAEAPITIGRVLPHYEAYILDEQKQLLPPGAIGSLHLGGPALARAYRNRPELTAEKFIAHPFKAGARLYDTGDLCRYRADGQLEYISRKDNQIKLRGYRIELGEIESVMSQVPDIKQAVVIVREDQPGDQRLVAYAVCENGRSVQLSALLQALRQTLPSYMLPNHLVLLPQFPLTGSGKIDKKALPAPKAEAEPGTTAANLHAEASLNPAEESLAAIWRDMIGIKRVRRSDNFFDLGGHSLLALKVLHRCQQELNASFKVRDLLLMNLSQLASQLPAQEAAGLMKGKGDKS